MCYLLILWKKKVDTQQPLLRAWLCKQAMESLVNRVTGRKGVFRIHMNANVQTLSKLTIVRIQKN